MKHNLLTQHNSKSQRKIVFAIWEIKTLPDDLDEFHISCGADDDSQDDGYFMYNKGAKLLIERITGLSDINYRITLIAPSRCLQRYKDYWLSPNQVDGQDAKDFGIM